jgi:hypothetical protein
VVYTCHDIFELRSLEGVPFCFVRPCLVASFGIISLASDSMGKESHRLDVVGFHTGSQRYTFGGLHGIIENLTQPLLPKRLAQERQNVTF